MSEALLGGTALEHLEEVDKDGSVLSSFPHSCCQTKLTSLMLFYANTKFTLLTLQKRPYALMAEKHALLCFFITPLAILWQGKGSKMTYDFYILPHCPFLY